MLNHNYLIDVYDIEFWRSIDVIKKKKKSGTCDLDFGLVDFSSKKLLIQLCFRTISSRTPKMYERHSLEKPPLSFQRFKKMTNNEDLEPKA